MAALSDPAVAFDPFASIVSPSTLAAIQGDTRLGLASEMHEYSAQWSGPVESSMAGAMAAAVGLEYRTQTLSECDSTMPMGTCDHYRRLKAAFAELAAPLFGRDRTYAGLQALELSTPTRTTPVIGLSLPCVLRCKWQTG